MADATLEHATRYALAEKGLDGGLTVVAMGKLGGREIGYGSDLDIFFVYEPGDDDDGSAERYVRAAQRVLRLVSAPHGDGPGYELDTRLRPSGSHGLLVVSLEAFARYHGLNADGTPHGTSRRAGLGAAGARQGARQPPATPSSDVASRRSRTKIAYERGAPDPERVHHLRMRMENELAREAPHRYDVKLGRGGIVDVEFAVQWLQMKHGQRPARPDDGHRDGPERPRGLRLSRGEHSSGPPRGVRAPPPPRAGATGGPRYEREPHRGGGTWCRGAWRAEWASGTGRRRHRGASSSVTGP